MASFEPSITPGGDEIVIDREASTRGSEDPFYPAYETPDRDRRRGWFCSHCGSVDAVMGPMGRIECAECTNARKPTQWDTCYL